MCGSKPFLILTPAQVALERPETPQSSGLRKTFDELRPDTMESKFNGDSPRSDEGNEAKVEIGKHLFIIP